MITISKGKIHTTLNFDKRVKHHKVIVGANNLVEFILDDYGRIVDVNTTYIHGTKERYTIEYDKSDNVTLVRNLRDDFYWRNLYDERGNIIRIVTSNEAGLRAYQYGYDENNNIISYYDYLNQWCKMRYEGNTMVYYEDCRGDWWDKSVTPNVEFPYKLFHIKPESFRVEIA